MVQPCWIKPRLRYVAYCRRSLGKTPQRPPFRAERDDSLADCHRSYSWERVYGFAYWPQQMYLFLGDWLVLDHHKSVYAAALMKNSHHYRQSVRIIWMAALVDS
jgi:hypothetical protein